jgi:hypothetical protein
MEKARKGGRIDGDGIVRTCIDTPVGVGVGALPVTLAVHPVLRWRSR